MLRCHVLRVVRGTLPLLSHPLSKVSGISIQPFAGPMALTSFPFCFSTFGSFGPEELLSRIFQRYYSHARIPKWEAHAWVFRRLFFAIMRGVAEHPVGRQLVIFSWWFSCACNYLQWCTLLSVAHNTHNHGFMNLYWSHRHSGSFRWKSVRRWGKGVYSLITLLIHTIQ